MKKNVQLIHLENSFCSLYPCLPPHNYDEIYLTGIKYLQIISINYHK